MIRIAQTARALGIYLEVCGQRFSSGLGKGTAMLRAQLIGCVVRCVNGKQTAGIGLGDIAPDAVFAVTTIAPEHPGVWRTGSTPGTAIPPAVSVHRDIQHNRETAHEHCAELQDQLALEGAAS